MRASRVLIAGASIAGPALAHWLGRYGWETTIVERSRSLRTGGQNVDVRGAGREVARRMGIEDDIRAATTGELGTRFVGPTGAVVAEFPAGTSDSGGMTAELEILRGDLARLLVGSTGSTGSDRGPATEYLWGDRIVALADDGLGVTVTFERGPERRFDLVVAADGIGSSTRGLVFGSEVEIRSLGLETTWMTIPRTPSDTDWWYWYNAPGGRAVTLRPDAEGTIRATVSVLTEGERAGAEQRSVEGQKRLLRARFADVGWEAPRVLAAMDDADDLYSESVGQVRAPRWSAGRVALVGDAAYCASPISGMGTSLALVGAYVLAGELAAHVDHRDAFRGYERIVRPYVEQAQKLPPGAPRLAHPRTAVGIRLFGLGLRAGSTRFAGKLGERFPASRADAIDLPDYAHLER